MTDLEIATLAAALILVASMFSVEFAISMIADEIANSTLNMEATRIRAAARVAISRSVIHTLLDARGGPDACHYHEIGGRGHQPAWCRRFQEASLIAR